MRPATRSNGDNRKFTATMPDFSGRSDAYAVKLIAQWMDDSNNFVQVNADSATVRSGTEYRVKNVANNSQDDNYQLEFRVTAFNAANDSRSSGWTPLRSQRIQNELVDKDGWCHVFNIANKAFDSLSIALALYSGGLSAAVLATLKASGSYTNVSNGAKMLLDCYKDPVDALKDISPLIGVVLELSGIAKNLRCRHHIYHHIGHRDFDFDSIDDLLDAREKACR